MTGNLGEVREAGGVFLELHGGDKPALVLRQGDSVSWVELADVKALVAALVEGAADLAEVLARGAG